MRALDNDDFGATDVPPPERLTLPSAHAVDEKSREEARDWVLTVSMDRAVTQQLPERACASARAAFAGAWTCHSSRLASGGAPSPGGPCPRASASTLAAAAERKERTGMPGRTPCSTPVDSAGKAATK